MGSDLILAFAKSCHGRACIIERRDCDWVFRFGNGNIFVSSPWRLIHDGRIAFGSDDDGHTFGHPSPIDGEALANTIVKGRHIADVEFDHVTADVRLHFDGGVRLDIFNPSMAYEAWTAGIDGEIAMIIGRGSGIVIV